MGELNSDDHYIYYCGQESLRRNGVALIELPGGSDSKASCLQCGIRSLGREDPLEKEWQPTPVLLPGKSHGWRSVVGYSPWGHKELDTTERS